MGFNSLARTLRHLWNWYRGKRIVHADTKRGRVVVRTGHNSAHRSNGCQWYLQRYVVAQGLPPLPRCTRGHLDEPATFLSVTRVDGTKLDQARRWYERRHGALPDGQELELVCVFDPDVDTPASRALCYRPNEIYEIEYPWLSSDYSGEPFGTYSGTWYGSGTLRTDAIMDFEIFWEVGANGSPLPSRGASWR